jgi:chemotaxis regulatin CheY-phosphate phosphatase CheZ
MSKDNRVDLNELNQMLREGKSGKEIAQFFSVSPSAISHAKKRLKYVVVKSSTLEKGTEILEYEFNLIEQLSKINKTINDLLDDLVKKAGDAGQKDLPALRADIVKICETIRRQIETKARVAELWQDVKQRGAFQDEVFRILDEFQPGVRREAIERLRAAGLLLPATTIN